MNNQNLLTSRTKTKIIVLWTAPRCVSTAFEKVFSRRPDTTTVHEPFLDTYHFSRWRRTTRFGDYEARLDYGTDQVIEHIKAQKSPLVFIKEMAYHALPYIEKEFVNSAVNTFLIRNPKKSLLSWYKLEEFPTEEEFGFEGLMQMWKLITEEFQHKPIIIDADRFQTNPEQTLKSYCQAIDIEFIPEMLSWQEGRVKQPNPRKEEIHNKWHQTLINSNGILPPTPAVGEIRSQDLSMLEQAMDVYQQLAQLSL